MQMRSAGPGAVKTHIWDKIDPCNIVKYKGTAFEASLAKFGVLMKARGTTGHTPEHIGRCIALQLVQLCRLAWYLPAYMMVDSMTHHLSHEQLHVSSRTSPLSPASDKF